MHSLIIVNMALKNILPSKYDIENRYYYLKVPGRLLNILSISKNLYLG